mmetsp:Transcript_27831/g.62121  ORF Transcript_27831/g.62121 Transcript_27831/m.62121 type:complete len:150 (-) Transcript_27831:112-561(-)
MKWVSGFLRWQAGVVVLVCVTEWRPRHIRQEKRASATMAPPNEPVNVVVTETAQKLVKPVGKGAEARMLKLDPIILYGVESKTCGACATQRVTGASWEAGTPQRAILCQGLDGRRPFMRCQPTSRAAVAGAVLVVAEGALGQVEVEVPS